MKDSEKTNFAEKTSRASLFGAGVFTTVAVRHGDLLLWEKHWRRLVENTRRLGIDLAARTERSTVHAVQVAVSNHKLENGRVRITLFDQRPSELWPSSESSEETTGIQIAVGEPRIPAERFKLAISPFPGNSRSPLAGVKSCNYIEQILSLDEAKGRGFHEAVRVNEHGHVASGCMSNIFWLKNDRLFTPTLATGCLAGTTREYVLENIACEEVEAEIAELESADEIYLTSAGLGIVRVAEFNGRELASAKHPIQTLWPPP